MLEAASSTSPDCPHLVSAAHLEGVQLHLPSGYIRTVFNPITHTDQCSFSLSPFRNVLFPGQRLPGCFQPPFLLSALPDCSAAGLGAFLSVCDASKSKKRKRTAGDRALPGLSRPAVGIASPEAARCRALPEGDRRYAPGPGATYRRPSRAPLL